MRKKILKGQSSVEIIIALAILLIFISGVLVLFFYSVDNIRQSAEIDQARNLAREGLEAVRSIAEEDWSNLNNGSYDVEYTSGHWQFTAPNSYLWLGKYHRQIDISSLYRDSSTCELKESGDLEDTDIKKIVSVVSWEFKGKTKIVSYPTYLTNWRNPLVECPSGGGGGGSGGQASALTFDGSSSSRDEYISGVNLLVTIDGFKVTNDSTDPVVIDKVQVFVDKTSMRIFSFSINGWIRWWNFFSPKPSGTILDINNYTLSPGETADIRMDFFTSEHGPVTFSINFIMEDGTEKETDKITI